MKRKKVWIIGIVVILGLGAYFVSQSHEDKDITEIPEVSFTETEVTTQETAKPQAEETVAETKTEEIATEPKTEDEKPTSDSDNSNVEENGLRKDFKEAMDSYETFMNEYCDFMKKYNDNPTDPGLIADYASYAAKYADFVSKFGKWENEDLNDAETAYYIEVQTRVNNRLAEVAH